MPKYIDAIIAGLTTAVSNDLLIGLLLVLKLTFLFPSQWDFPYRPALCLEEQQLETLLGVIQSETNDLPHDDAVAVVASIWYHQREAVEHLVANEVYYDFNDKVVVAVAAQPGFLLRDCCDYHDLVLAHVGDNEEALSEWVEEHYDNLNKTVGKSLWYKYVYE